MRILFVAADKMEYSGILARAGDVRVRRSKVDWARAARLGGHEVLLTANGAGAMRAAAPISCPAGTSHPSWSGSTSSSPFRVRRACWHGPELAAS